MATKQGKQITKPCIIVGEAPAGTQPIYVSADRTAAKDNDQQRGAQLPPRRSRDLLPAKRESADTKFPKGARDNEDHSLPLELRAARYAVFRRERREDNRKKYSHPTRKPENSTGRNLGDDKENKTPKGNIREKDDKPKEVKVPTATSKKMCQPEKRGSLELRQEWKSWSWGGKRTEKAAKKTDSTPEINEISPENEGAPTYIIRSVLFKHRFT